MLMRGPTTNHAEIERWATSRQATPAEIRPFIFNGEPAVLCFLFAPLPDEQREFKRISWENFFAHFDLMGLAFVYAAEVGGEAGKHYELLQQETKSPFGFNAFPH